MKERRYAAELLTLKSIAYTLRCGVCVDHHSLRVDYFSPYQCSASVVGFLLYPLICSLKTVGLFCMWTFFCFVVASYAHYQLFTETQYI